MHYVFAGFVSLTLSAVGLYGVDHCMCDAGWARVLALLVMLAPWVVLPAIAGYLFARAPSRLWPAALWAVACTTGPTACVLIAWAWFTTGFDRFVNTLLMIYFTPFLGVAGLGLSALGAWVAKLRSP
ncbi:MAG: hypothetical protein WD770_11640 [Actinomycetota bacterium]